MTDTEHRRDDAPPGAIGGGPYFVSAVQGHVAGERRRTMVTISRLPGADQTDGTPQPRRRPRPGPGRARAVRSEPRRPRPGPAAPTTRPTAKRKRKRWPAVVTLAALGLAVAIPFLVQAILLLGGRDDDVSAAHNSSTPRAPVRRAADASVPPAVVTWTRSALPSSVSIATAADVAATLRRAGYPHAVGYGDPAASSAEYVLDVPAAAGTSAGRRLIARSLPLASFPSTNGTVSVRRTITAGDTGNGTTGPDDVTAADISTSVRANLALRVAGGRELLRNPALSADAATARALRDGSVDLRAENVLADLAASDLVRVGQPVLDPAEKRAGLPIRSVVVATDDITTTTKALRSEQAPYRPDSIVAVSPTSVRVTWTPAPPLGT